MTEALRSDKGSALAEVVRVVPMERINAVLLVSAQPRYIDDARRVFGLVERARRQTVGGWSVFYLQNSKSNDVAYVLQQAFTPNRVTAVPSARAVGASSRSSFGTNSFNSSNGGRGGAAAGLAGAPAGGSAVARGSVSAAGFRPSLLPAAASARPIRRSPSSQPGRIRPTRCSAASSPAAAVRAATKPT